MSAERLRDAAKVLRKRAEAATPGPWTWLVNDHRDRALIGRFQPDADVQYVVATSGDEDDADYIATMSPSVALALADWLDDFANVNLRWSERPGAGPIEPGLPALAVAAAILGGVA